MQDEQHSFGQMLRDWRLRRRYSQLALALEAEISQRHLSFLESGRSNPSRDMILRLAEFLQMPLRDRNALLAAAGYVPAYRARGLTSPDMEQARTAIEGILTGHEPHPALAVDRCWTLCLANRAVAVLTEGAAPSLLAGEVNVLRLSLHPEGLARRIVNFREWRDHILARLAHDIDLTADPQLIDLHKELRAYPAPPGAAPRRKPVVATSEIAVPLVIRSREGPLAFLSTTTLFGTAVDITLADIVIESFFPADPQTAAAMVRLMAGP
ncbi:helix-turn-helix domain-containing protein [Paracoccus onubensis]|uniref:XRE family transcriptional regulator n=1 Tax=Paracoccus onubensis TaxID=1675788 RepID=A0A418T8K7_9RHOB|nr:helix-turn-helix transcriptional regulator [Paracoccus onubensis]RJE89565.1 XRE family transcriptional regulator [Paracoccus onubensis]